MINKTIFLLISGLFLMTMLFSGAVYSQDQSQWLSYSSQGQAQAAGLNFTLKYPSYYQKETGFDKNVYLQTFGILDEEGSGDTYEYLTVAIQDLPKNIDGSSLQANGNWDNQKLEELWKSLASSIQGAQSQEQAIGFGNIPMAKIRVYNNNGEVVTVEAVEYALHKDKLIKLECGFNTFAGEVGYGSDIDYTKDETCVLYFNSLTFTD
ncbi:MAG: hypothetical protein LBE80_11140 [Deltaproteobacteria bacterium]|jgi:hypothetical protein|nr:hypothetical protein [Deltaproteobacteria bacterium]